MLGLDLGSWKSVLAQALSPISADVVLNQVSQRETRTLISFREDQRLVGEFATNQNSTQYFTRLLGKPHNDEPLCALNHGLTPTQLTAAFLSHLLNSFRMQTISIAVQHQTPYTQFYQCPQYYTEFEKKALLNAAAIA